MEFLIQKGSGIPIYKQVKSFITERIRSGEFAPGYKMPTERELSDSLKISRNTVSTAYKDLEKEGLLVSHQGKGTFVSEHFDLSFVTDANERVMRFIDLGLEEAMDTKMEPYDFLKLVEARVKEKLDLMRTSNAVYIECNIEQAEAFAKQLEERTGMRCLPLTVQDLIDMKDETKLTIYNSKVLVSTFNHVSEVMEHTNQFNKEILGVAINPDLATVVRIARCPKDTKFAFVTISREFMEKTKLSLENSGLDDVDIIYTNESDDEKLSEIIKDVDICIVSPGRYKDVLRIMKDPNKIIRFEYNLDDGSVKALKSKLLELNIV